MSVGSTLPYIFYTNLIDASFENCEMYLNHAGGEKKNYEQLCRKLLEGYTAHLFESRNTQSKAQSNHKSFKLVITEHFIKAQEAVSKQLAAELDELTTKFDRKSEEFKYAQRAVLTQLAGEIEQLVFQIVNIYNKYESASKLVNTRMSDLANNDQIPIEDLQAPNEDE
jgi:hypothetical protein